MEVDLLEVIQRATVKGAHGQWRAGEGGWEVEGCCHIGPFLLLGDDVCPSDARYEIIECV